MQNAIKLNVFKIMRIAVRKLQRGDMRLNRVFAAFIYRGVPVNLE